MNPIDTFNLDARSLRVLLAVLDDGSVSGAAVKLGLSQSAVSHTLDRLRQALGDPLFVKSGRGIAPTHYTLRIGPHVRQILDDLRTLSAGPPFVPRDADFTVTIAANDYQRDLLLPPLMQRLREQAPGIGLQVIPSGIPNADMLRKEVCDLIISPHPPAASDILQRRLLDDQMMIFYDPAHRTAPTSLADYLQAEHVAILFGTGEPTALEGSLSARGLARKTRVTVSNFSGLAGFLKGTQLLATAPSMMSKHLLSNFASAPLPFDYKPFTLMMLWHQRNQSDPAHRWLRQQLIEVADQLGD
ncbi:LysR family transcriptional regulator [Marinobacter zhejiangensis]|uniref:DNA-binding transcriptional regulator, LysR family n=1 Tax=Marinobacter zhejiangensis TaxID=488535 RepID=A0A1I4LGL9_9GAMM|nr:LysR family transcriptional regulator [Marinobacter zhejiangensis]SFL90080.1 DNA-binding transcriptional regulator, LysR family [Marinobacter zhejiangensis]